MLCLNVSRPVCLGIKHPYGAYDQIFYYCQTFAGFLMWGARSDERTGLSFPKVTVSSNKSVASMYILHFTCYKMYVYTAYTGPLSVQATSGLKLYSRRTGQRTENKASSIAA
jgi:hypothetical protein